MVYPSNLMQVATAQVRFEDATFSWRSNKQPGDNDFLLLEGAYSYNESGFLILNIDKAVFEAAGEGQNRALAVESFNGARCFAFVENEETKCLVKVQQSSQYVVSATNVQFNVTFGSGDTQRVFVTNVNRDL